MSYIYLTKEVPLAQRRAAAVQSAELWLVKQKAELGVERLEPNARAYGPACHPHVEGVPCL